jgi:inosine-uridine nucleoside N-ribohydrolase
MRSWPLRTSSNEARTKFVTRERLIIDCDPGHDDFAAIALAATSGAFDIEAITTVCGNAPLVHTAANGVAIAAALGLATPVYAGAEAPLLHRYNFPTAFHGETGLDSNGANLPASERALSPGHAALEILKRINAAPGEITIAVVGPMTNLALALALDPSMAGRVKQLVFMGGGIGGGNVTPRAEFNIWADAEAASIVLRSGIKATMFGLDVTNRAWLAPEDLAELHAAVPAPNPVADIIQFYADRSGDGQGPALHDTCPIAWLLDPTLFRIEALAVDVDTSPGLSYGATFADTRGWAPKDGPRIGVALEVDRPRLARRVTDALVATALRLSA